MVSDTDGGWDEQDQSEVFDEDNQNLDGAGETDGEMRTFEDLPDVLDVTTAVGDADDDAALIAEDLDDEEIIALEADSELADLEDDELADRMPDDLDENDAGARLSEEGTLDVRDEEEAMQNDEAAEFLMNRGTSDEVELEYAGDLDNASVREGKRTAAMESRVLSDDDLDDLGYPGDEEPAQKSETAEIQRRR